jgi:hypothetical protein
VLDSGPLGINNGSELFGSSTVMANGQNASNGYQALIALGTDNNGVISITSADSIFSRLQVWVNAYDPSQPQELLSLSQLGIVSLNLNTTGKMDKNNGNLIGMESSYTTTSGATYAMGDVWFTVDNKAVSALTTSQVAALTSTQVAALTTTQVARFNTSDIAVLTTTQIASLSATDVAVLSSSQIGALSNVQIAALSSGQVGALNANQMASLGTDMIAKLSLQESQTLQAQVSSLTNALSLFNSTALEIANNTVASNLTSMTNSQGMTINQAVAVNVNSLVSALKLFDANGNLIAPSALQTASSTPLTPAIPKPPSTGFLAS